VNYVRRERQDLTASQRDQMRGILEVYAEEVVEDAAGWKICCPFHNDSRPSCTVFYGSGVFSCFSCGAKQSPVKGLIKLGVPEEHVKDIFEVKEDDSQIRRIKSLLELEEPTPPKQPTIGIIDREPWVPGWAFRKIRSEFLLEQLDLKPELVRLWIRNRQGKINQERFQRLSLAYTDHALFLRLSSEQKVRVFNSPGLQLADPILPPFGLPSFKVSKALAGIFIVEGPYDLLRTRQHLYDLGISNHFAVVALLGVSQWQSFLIKYELRLQSTCGNIPLLFALDNDDAGNALLIKAQKDLARLQAPSLVFQYPGKDPGDLDLLPFKNSLLDLGF